ncbi:hypothetical protein HK102_000871 [Quaeritorhiza haematococci]|nr:hypothetical protein HK102_000871 [Quaeritorhiza haematococci]
MVLEHQRPGENTGIGVGGLRSSAGGNSPATSAPPPNTPVTPAGPAPMTLNLSASLQGEVDMVDLESSYEGVKVEYYDNPEEDETTTTGGAGTEEGEEGDYEDEGGNIVSRTQQRRHLHHHRHRREESAAEEGDDEGDGGGADAIESLEDGGGGGRSSHVSAAGVVGSVVGSSPLRKGVGLVSHRQQGGRQGLAAVGGGAGDDGATAAAGGAPRRSSSPPRPRSGSGRRKQSPTSPLRRGSGPKKHVQIASQRITTSTSTSPINLLPPSPSDILNRRDERHLPHSGTGKPDYLPSNPYEDPSVPPLQKYTKAAVNLVLMPFFQGMFYGLGEGAAKYIIGKYWSSPATALPKKAVGVSAKVGLEDVAATAFATVPKNAEVNPIMVADGSAPTHQRKGLEIVCDLKEEEVDASCSSSAAGFAYDSHRIHRATTSMGLMMLDNRKLLRSFVEMVNENVDDGLGLMNVLFVKQAFGSSVTSLAGRCATSTAPTKFQVWEETSPFAVFRWTRLKA